MTRSDTYKQKIREIRESLPPEAFRRSPSKLVWMAVHVGVICAAIFFAATIETLALILIAVLVAGNSLLSLGLLTHELSHGAVLKRGLLRSMLETLLWALNFASRTIWIKVHNREHHTHYSTPADPDRHFLESEKTPGNTWFTLLFLPNRVTQGNPLVLLEWLAYWARNYLAALLPRKHRPTYVPAHPDWSVRERLGVVIDLLVIGCIHVTLFHLLDVSLAKYVCVVGLSYCVSSWGAGTYIFTNHMLKPIAEHHNPISGSTSVIVPRWIDWMHSHFSYHTEHHVFPSMNSRYYPELSRQLEEAFPEHYERIPIITAWRRLWSNPVFEKDTERAAV